MSIWTRLHRLIDRLASIACRHPKGVVCEHRGYAHDRWYRGYIDGFAAGKGNTEAKWRGSISGEGPYANYPPPAAAADAARAALEGRDE